MKLINMLMSFSREDAIKEKLIREVNENIIPFADD